MSVILVLLLLSGCGRPEVPPGNGPIANEYFAPVELKRFDTGEVLGSMIEVKKGDAFAVVFDIKGADNRPGTYQETPVAPPENSPCLFAAYPPNVKPSLKAKPAGETTSAFAAICRVIPLQQIPLSGFGPWAGEFSQKDLPPSIPVERLAKDQGTPFYTIIGPTHDKAGDYTLDLYTYPTFHKEGPRYHPGEPVLLWRGTLRIVGE